MQSASNLTNLQLELLKLFSFEVNDQQLIEIRNLLASYFAKEATQEMDKLMENENWTDKTIEEWSREHL